MGIETAALVMGGIAAAGTVGKMGFEVSAAKAREHALDLQAQEQKVAYEQKTLDNLDIMQKTLAAQEAAMTTRGVAFSSPSFNAIQRSTLNTGAKRQRNLNTEEDLSQANINIEKKNVKNQLFAQLFGDVADFAMSGYSFYNAAPKKLPKMEE